MNDARWKEMLDAFRALGGTADNVRLGQGALGRGLFPIDPQRPVRLHAPANLLMDEDWIVFENGALRLAPDAEIGTREREFFEGYQADFAWGSKGRAETVALLEAAQALPGELRHKLLTEFGCGSWFEDYSEDLVQRKFVASRRIEANGRSVLMPVLELANHGPGDGFDTENGVSLTGIFPDEVLARYSDIDSYGLFTNWGIAHQQRQAMSIVLSGAIGQTPIRVEREIGDFNSAERPWIPGIAQSKDGILLDFLMIGNRQYPRLSKGIFHKLMRDAGLSGFEEAFETIQHVNRIHFLELLAALDGLHLPMARTLGRMARLQLQTMAFCAGVRPI